MSLAHSLRARLLLLLLAAIVVTAGVQAVFAYRTALAETDAIFDYQMQQMALSLRPGLPLATELVDPDPDSSDDNFEFVVQVWTADGARVFQSTGSAELPRPAALGFSRIENRSTTYRVFSAAVGKQVVQVAQDIASRQTMARRLAYRTVGPMAFMVPLLMLVVWWVVSASLAPVARVRQQLALRQADALSEVDERGLPDEIAPLVFELNLLFNRVRQAFDAQKNFVADAAHELRSPLAALKLQLQGLRRAQDDEARERAIQRLGAGIDRASRLVEQLLVLARQQASQPVVAGNNVVPLTKLVQSILADQWETASTRQIDLGLVTTEEGLIVGQEDSLRILLRNLVDNAINFTPNGGTVNVGVRSKDGRTLLTVEDSGPGIAPQDRDRVFDRFYRAAGEPGSGSGLGLSIVKTIADLHKASLSVERSEALGGLQITVRFPVAL